MTGKLVVFGLSGLAMALTLCGAEKPLRRGPEQSFEVTSTERVNFLPGGTVHLNGSYGYLTVEGWDEPQVEIKVTKSTNHFYEPEQKGKAEQSFPEVRVVTERRSDKDLQISTTLPPRGNHFSRHFLPNNTKGVTVEYQVHVPRDSRLVVHQDNGYVWVSDLTGDIEVNSHTGDLIVMLPDPGPYSIDAKTRLGSVSSDFAGKGVKQFLTGTHFTYASQIPSRQVSLRMGRGSITIIGGPPSGPFWKN